MYITGGSSGLGLALSKIVASKGAHVSIVARNEKNLVAALTEIEVCISPVIFFSFTVIPLYVRGELYGHDDPTKAEAQGQSSVFVFYPELSSRLQACPTLLEFWSESSPTSARTVGPASFNTLPVAWRAWFTHELKQIDGEWAVKIGHT